MIFESPLRRFLKGTAIVLVMTVTWLWMTAADYELEQEIWQEEQQRRAQLALLQQQIVSEPEPELPEYKEPVQEPILWTAPPEPVRKTAAKVKRKIKKSVKKGQ